MRNSTFILLTAALLLSTACKNRKASTDKAPVATTEKPAERPTDKPVKLPEYASPESVLAYGDHIYVANIGPELTPRAKDGDGYIMQLDKTGKQWLNADDFGKIRLNGPKGMAILDGILYVTDIDRIVGIDLAKWEVVKKLDMSETGTLFLNDLCIKDETTLFLTATDIQKIYTLDVTTMKATEMEVKMEMRGPNGVTYQSEGNKLFCVESGEKGNGRVLQIDVGSGTTKVLVEHEGGLDGVDFTRSGELIFSDWYTGKIYAVDYKGQKRALNDDRIEGPADFHFDLATNTLWIPNMKANKLTSIQF